jgi:hypothetical protein
VYQPDEHVLGSATANQMAAVRPQHMRLPRAA